MGGWDWSDKSDYNYLYNLDLVKLYKVTLSDCLTASSRLNCKSRSAGEKRRREEGGGRDTKMIINA